jgi:dephospho-CoA kinase
MFIAFTGMPGSGKTTATLYLKDHHNFSIVDMGRIVRKTMNDRGIQINNESLRAFSKALREDLGPSATAQLTLPYIKKMHGNIVIDGVRGPEEVEYFKENLKDKKFYLVSISAPDSIRYSRLSDRKRYDDPSTLAGLKERDNKEVEFGILKSMKLADIVIMNTGTEEEFFKNLDVTLERLRGDLFS